MKAEPSSPHPPRKSRSGSTSSTKKEDQTDTSPKERSTEETSRKESKEFVSDWGEWLDAGNKVVPAELDPRSELEGGDVFVDGILAFFGKRRSGKTTLMKYILTHMREYYGSMVVFSSTDFNMQWAGWTHPNQIYRQFTDAVLQELLNQQKEIRIEYEKSTMTDGKFAKFCDETGFHRLILVFDDMIAGRDGDRIKKSDAIQTLFANGRHYNTMILFSTQDPKNVYTPLMRSNTDMAFLFQQNSMRNRESVAEDFSARFRKRDYMPVMDEHTADHGVLIVMNNPTTLHPNDFFRHYRLGKEKADKMNNMTDKDLEKVRITRLLESQGVEIPDFEKQQKIILKRAKNYKKAGKSSSLYERMAKEALASVL